MQTAKLMTLLIFLLAGCDYTVPLTEQPKIDIDQSLVGLWQRITDNGQGEKLLILAMSGKEYMISFPTESREAMFARASLLHESGLVLVQIDWFGTSQARVPENSRTFQYASYSIDGATLALRLLNPEVIPPEITSSTELAREIADQQENPNLFRDERFFEKVK